MKNRTLRMIPGPIEFEPAVLSALGAPTGHVAVASPNVVFTPFLLAPNPNAGA